MRKAISLGMRLKLGVERENVPGFIGLWQALLLACHRPCLLRIWLDSQLLLLKLLTVLFCLTSELEENEVIDLQNCQDSLAGRKQTMSVTVLSP